MGNIYLCPNFRGDEKDLDKFKPTKGQNVFYRGNSHGTITNVDGNICGVRKNDGTHTIFIWRFKDGLNNMHRWT